jgi:hypothetical protein
LEFCADDALAYSASRHPFPPGAALPLGADYRLAHLPLVAPGHPEAIASVPGRDYLNGSYATPRDALAVQLPLEALDASPAYREAEADLRAGRFAAKIAWHLTARRRDVLHATIAGPIGEAQAAKAIPAAGALLKRRGTVAVRFGGPLVGTRNHGRIYLPAYPERIDGGDPFGDLQEACGWRRTRFYAVGLWHLSDGLDAAEATDLAGIVDKWFGRETVRLPAARFGILRVHDDLALDRATWRWIDSRDCP